MTKSEKTLENLNKIAHLLSRADRWTKNTSARDLNGVGIDPKSEEAHSFCVTGAIARVISFDYPNDEFDSEYKNVIEVINQVVYGGKPSFNQSPYGLLNSPVDNVVGWNDDSETTFQDVQNAILKAKQFLEEKIEEEKAKETLLANLDALEQLLDTPEKWIKGHFAVKGDPTVRAEFTTCDINNPEACAWCLSGAVERVVKSDDELHLNQSRLLRDALADQLGKLYGEPPDKWKNTNGAWHIPNWNDNVASYAQVRNLIRETRKTVNESL